MKQSLELWTGDLFNQTAIRTEDRRLYQTVIRTVDSRSMLNQTAIRTEDRMLNQNCGKEIYAKLDRQLVKLGTGD